MKVFKGVVLVFGLVFGVSCGQNSTSETKDNEVDTGEDVKQVTYDDLTPELRNWTVPEYLSKNFPAYLSGFDYEDRPIWVCEIGKYDMRIIFSRGPEAQEEAEKYARYAARILTDSHKLKNPNVDHISVIVDFDGLQLVQYAQIPVIRFLFHMAREFVPLLELHIEQLIIINANFVSHTFMNLMKPVFGRLLGTAEVYGTDKSVWLPQLLKTFPRESLPEWYGGYKNFTPVKVIG